MDMSLEIWTGPGGGKDFTRRDGIFFLENSDRLFPVGLFREASWEMFQPMILGFVFFGNVPSGTDFGLCVLVEKQVPASVRGFRALKYDVRHTPIVIERIAKEWKLKRT